VITEQMMEDYRRLSAVSVEERAKGLDHWLERYGHRGPLESDPSRPRFAELRDVLLHDLNSMPVGQQQTLNSESWLARRFRFCFRVDEIREWFRDSLMRRWQTLRQRVLTAAQLAVAEGLLDRMEDVFWLRGEDLGRSRFQELVQRNRQRHEAAKSIEAPLTATAAEIETMLANADRQKAHGGGRQMFPGISLNPTTIEGIVRKADDLIELLRDSSSVGPNTILVVPTLEPSWAVVFARVAGVVADVGGELSHASILLRETRKPALVNCTGIYAQIETGDRLRINGIAGVAEVLGRSEASRPGS
jgi:pyruvate,water dikinase